MVSKGQCQRFNSSVFICYALRGLSSKLRNTPDYVVRGELKTVIDHDFKRSTCWSSLAFLHR